MLSGEQFTELKERALNTEPIYIVVRELRRMLGDVRFVVILSGKKKDVQSVEEWAHGSLKPGKVEERRLRYAYLAAKIIEEDYSTDTVAPAFMGSNSHLNDHAMIVWLADHEEEKDLYEVVGAALNFGEQGG